MLLNGAALNGAALNGSGSESVVVATDSLGPSQFGTPSGHSLFAAQPLVGANFGTPSYPHSTYHDAANLAVSKFGPADAIYIAPQPPSSLIHQASSLMKVVFGLPEMAGHLVAEADGFGVAVFGDPVVRLVNEAGSLQPTGFGQPSAAQTQKAQSLHTTAFGVPLAHMVYEGQPLGPSRFAIPRLYQSNVYKAASLQGTTFGQPGSRLWRDPHDVESLTGVNFGTPESGSVFRVMSMPSASHFGAPTLIRSSAC